MFIDSIRSRFIFIYFIFLYDFEIYTVSTVFYRFLFVWK